MKLQFSITICSSFFNSLSAVLCFCGLRADCLKSRVTSEKKLSIYLSGYPWASRHHLKFARHSSNVVFEESVLSSLIASALIKPLFTPFLSQSGVSISFQSKWS